MQVPPSSHFIYIPVILVLGIIFGFILGAKATRDAIAVEQRKQAEREARRAARAARTAGDPTTAATVPPGDGASEQSGGGS